MSTHCSFKRFVRYALRAGHSEQSTPLLKSSRRAWAPLVLALLFRFFLLLDEYVLFHRFVFHLHRRELISAVWSDVRASAGHCPGRLTLDAGAKL